MAIVRSTSNFDVKIHLTLSELEAKALLNITEYGTDEFLGLFYKHMGKAALQPNERGLISLFETIREELPKHIRRADGARDIWNSVVKEDIRNIAEALKEENSKGE